MSDVFTFQGHWLSYFDHPYNHTVLNMRRVEIPIARWYIEKAGELARILEVGNVLAHYGPVNWPVLDLREKGAINADVMKWKPEQKVDLLISISTLEHVQAKPSAAVRRLRTFLVPGGTAVITVPTGYNAILDLQLSDGTIGADEVHCMRVYGANWWRECTLEAALAMPPRACANRWSGGLVVLVLHKQGRK